MSWNWSLMYPSNVQAQVKKTVSFYGMLLHFFYYCEGVWHFCQHNYPILQKPLLGIVKSVDQGVAHWGIHIHHHIQLCHSHCAGLE